MLPRSSINDSSTCVFLVHSADGYLKHAREVTRQLDAREVTISGAGETQARWEREIEASKEPNVVIVAVPVGSAVPVARTVRRLAPNAELILAVPPPEMESFRRKSQHSLLGRYRLVSPEDPAALISTAQERIRVVKQRKSFRTTIDRINVQLTPRSSIEPGELRRLAISDRYRASILNSAGDAIVSVDKDGYVTAWNQSAARLFRISDVEGRRLEDVSLGQCGAIFSDVINATFSTRTTLRREISCDSCDGHKLEVEATFAPVLDDYDAVIGVSIIVRDISATNRATRLLQAEHEVARHLVSGGPLEEVIPKVLATISEQIRAKVGEFWWLDHPKRYLTCAAVWTAPDFRNLTLIDEWRGLRFAKGEGMVGRVWKDLAPFIVPEMEKETLPRAHSAFQSGLRSAMAFPVASESEFFGVITLFSDNEATADEHVSQMMAAIGNDVAQYMHRLRAERALQESAERLRFMAESMPQKVATATPSGEVNYFNQPWLEFTGLTLEQLRDWGWSQVVHPQDLAETVRLWKRSLATGAPFEVEHRLRRKDGVYRWHLSRARAMHDAEGKLLLWISSGTDIEDQKRAEEELERIVEERTARLRETVAELEGFSYSISHDMRAPLRSMHQYAQILLQEQSDRLAGDGPRQLQRILDAANRMDQLIQDILTYSRMARGTLTLQSVDLHKVFRELMEHYPAFQPPAADVQIVGDLMPVLGHEAAVTQCLSNLIGNAVKFVPAGTIPEVRIWTEERGDFVRLNVRDNGVGIAKKDQHRIFEIFVRVYPERIYGGTGIGLSIVRKAVQRMGGNVGLESEAGKGSTFWIELKKALQEMPAAHNPTNPA